RPAMAAAPVGEGHGVPPAAEKHLGSAVSHSRHHGTSACRNVNRREAGRRSGHARGDAIGSAGFDLENGETVSVLKDWGSDTPKGRFLAEVQDGACGLFTTVLGPNYNAAHADHLHFEMARWGICR